MALLLLCPAVGLAVTGQGLALLDPLQLIQDKTLQTAQRRPYLPLPSLHTATLALG